MSIVDVEEDAEDAEEKRCERNFSFGTILFLATNYTMNEGKRIQQTLRNISCLLLVVLLLGFSLLRLLLVGARVPLPLLRLLHLVRPALPLARVLGGAGGGGEVELLLLVALPSLPFLRL